MIIIQQMQPQIRPQIESLLDPFPFAIAQFYRKNNDVRATTVLRDQCVSNLLLPLLSGCDGIGGFIAQSSEGIDELWKHAKMKFEKSRSNALVSILL